MWVRKNSKDRKAAALRKRTSPIFAATIAIVGVFVMVTRNFFYPHDPVMTWRNGPIMDHVVFGIFIFVVIYIIQVIFGQSVLVVFTRGRFPDVETMICIKCFEPKGKSESDQCICGGQLEPLSDWEWKEEFDGKPNA